MTSSTDIQTRKFTRLRTYRVAQGLRQSDLATLADCSRNTIVALEQGEQKPQLATALRIADALGAGVTEVFPLETEAESTE